MDVDQHEIAGGKNRCRLWPQQPGKGLGGGQRQLWGASTQVLQQLRQCFKSHLAGEHPLVAQRQAHHQLRLSRRGQQRLRQFLLVVHIPHANDQRAVAQ